MGRYTQRREAARNKPSLKKAKQHEARFVPQDLQYTLRIARRAWLISILSLKPLASFGDQGEFQNVTLLRILL